MIENTETGEALVTDVGGTERAGKTAGKLAAHIDPRDPDQVYQLALRLQNACRRTLMQPTLDEIQGLARLCVLATPVLQAAVNLVDASDSGEARPDSLKALADLMAITRAQLATMEPQA
jgi:hypothetical protein